MKRAHGNRVWRGMVLAAAIGAVAALALSGLALARGGDGERHRHGADTGTIASFDDETGLLAIQLSGEGGATVSGTVTRHTRIRCEDEHAPDVSSRALRRSNSGPGSGSDDYGGREEESGDDHGGHGNEPGDDHGGAVEPGDDNGGANEPGEDHGGRGPSGHDDNGAGANCTGSDLIPGAIVHEAELDLRNGKAVWDEVELNG
jgi:hypothetical protein